MHNNRLGRLAVILNSNNNLPRSEHSKKMQVDAGIAQFMAKAWVISVFLCFAFFVRFKYCIAQHPDQDCMTNFISFYILYLISVLLYSVGQIIIAYQYKSLHRTRREMKKKKRAVNLAIFPLFLASLILLLYSFVSVTVRNECKEDGCYNEIVVSAIVTIVLCAV